MELKVFSIYDQKARVFGNPFVAPTTGLAERMVKDIMRNPGHALAKYPEDFTLYEVGTWDDADGNFINTEPHNCGLLMRFLEEKENA